MMEQVNSARPRTLQFLRTDTSGRDILENEARTSAADDVAAYETALRNLPMLAKVEVRDLRTRDGVTALGLRIAFKPGALSTGEGTP